MTDFNVELDRVPTTDERVDYSVSVADGRTFRISFSQDLLEIWAEELERADRPLDLDPIAEEFVREILGHEPTDDQLSEGFCVTIDNGFATPTAAAENLRNSGLLPFLTHTDERLAPPPPTTGSLAGSDPSEPAPGFDSGSDE